MKCENQQTDMAENCPEIELNGQSREIMEKFFYLVEARGARVSAVYSYITRVRSRSR